MPFEETGANARTTNPPPDDSAAGVQTLNIRVSYGASVDSAPAAFKAAVHSAVRYLEHHFDDPITVNIRVEYKAIGGLGMSSFPLYGFSYSQILGAMTANTVTGDDRTALDSLSALDPIGGSHQYFLTPALAKALDLRGASSASDGTATFTSKQPFDYDRSDGIAAGKYDFFGTVLHEFTEIMGRILMTGGEQGGPNNGYTSLDLFHYADAGQRLFTGTKAGYFSIDGGRHALLDFNTNAGGDFGDWARSAAPDSFLAFSSSGVFNKISETDLREMDILGYDRIQGLKHTASADNSASHLVISDGVLAVHTGDNVLHLAGAEPAGLMDFV